MKRERDDFEIGYDFTRDVLQITDKAKHKVHAASAEYLIETICKVELKEITYED